MSALDQIHVLLPSLTPEELKGLRARLTAMLSLKVPLANSDNPVTRALDYVLRREGFRGAFLRYDIPAPLTAWLDDLVMKDVEKQAILVLGFTLLVEFLSKINVPITPKTMMGQSYRIPGLIDNDFPGYIRQGLLHLIIRSNNEYHHLAKAQSGKRPGPINS